MAQEATQAIGGAGAYESYVLCRWQEEAPPGLLSQEPALQPPLPSSCLFPCPTLGLILAQASRTASSATACWSAGSPYCP